MAYLDELQRALEIEQDFLKTVDLDRARSEAKARQQQPKLRRGDQRGVADQPGGLFDAERDQTSIFDGDEK